MTFATLNGLMGVGQCVSEDDGVTCTEAGGQTTGTPSYTDTTGSPTVSDILGAATGGAVTGGSAGIAPVTGNASTGFNFGSFISTLLGDATKLTSQAIGNTSIPAGYAMTASGAIVPASQVNTTTGQLMSSLSGMMPVLLIGGGLLVAVMVLKKR